MRHDIGVLAITFPFLMPPHLLRYFFGQEQPLEPWRDRYVTKLFDGHFCGDRDSIFIYNLHISGPTAVHTFGVSWLHIAPSTFHLVASALHLATSESPSVV
jgi:hypothetical protein